MANTIQQAITGSVAAAAAGIYGTKETLERQDAKKESAEAKKIQSAREEELHKLQVKGLKAENRTKRLQARTAKVELELATAKARDSLEASRLQAQRKSYKNKMQERLSGKVVK